MDAAFWQGKRVLVTGHTGFKGSWICLWLLQLGARVTGYALPPAGDVSLFSALGLGERLDRSEFGDVRDLERFRAVVEETAPELVVHLAAQPLVRDSYRDPVSTFSTNVMGTVHVLEAVRLASGVRGVLIVTSDKCYENREWVWAYREVEPLGGHDPYSSSKACTELVAASYRRSYFPREELRRHGTAVASVRAGNVIGGGDWSRERLLPDVMGALLQGVAVTLRNPSAVRPWQHVLEPLSGYLAVLERLHRHDPMACDAWNFGPREDDARSVAWVAERVADLWGRTPSWRPEDPARGHPHEAHNLKLDWSKARTYLGWSPRWDLDEALGRTVAWWRRYAESSGSARDSCLGDIASYMEAATDKPTHTLSSAHA